MLQQGFVAAQLDLLAGSLVLVEVHEVDVGVLARRRCSQSSSSHCHLHLDDITEVGGAEIYGVDRGV